MREKERIIYKEVKEKAQALHLKREKKLESFCTQIRKKLAHLHMKGFHFLARIHLTEDLHSRGLSSVSFLYQTSPGGSLYPLAKCASGGELSRLLLALKSSLRNGGSQKDTLCVFDEVDTGVSGVTAQRMGQSLYTLSRQQQLLVITHLPQVASYADKHFLLQKECQKEMFYITCKALSQKERVLELARLISGENLSHTSLSHAKQLLEEASPP